MPTTSPGYPPTLDSARDAMEKHLSPTTTTSTLFFPPKPWTAAPTRLMRLRVLPLRPPSAVHVGEGLTAPMRSSDPGLRAPRDEAAGSTTAVAALVLSAPLVKMGTRLASDAHSASTASGFPPTGSAPRRVLELQIPLDDVLHLGSLRTRLPPLNQRLQHHDHHRSRPRFQLRLARRSPPQRRGSRARDQRRLAQKSRRKS
jgi:hypothetical protein